MTSAATCRRRVAVAAAALLVLGAAGLVLASSWLVSYPANVLLPVWLVAVGAMITVFVAAYREARATETGLVTALGRSFKVLGQSILGFF